MSLVYSISEEEQSRVCWSLRVPIQPEINRHRATANRITHRGSRPQDVSWTLLCMVRIFFLCSIRRLTNSMLTWDDDASSRDLYLKAQERVTGDSAVDFCSGIRCFGTHVTLTL
jgi:hypothetical protein